MQQSTDMISQLFSELQAIREKYAKYGADDSDLNEALLGLFDDVADGNDVDDEDVGSDEDVVENTEEYWKGYLYASASDYVAEADVIDGAASELVEITRKIINAIPPKDRTQKNVEEYLDNSRSY